MLETSRETNKNGHYLVKKLVCMLFLWPIVTRNCIYTLKTDFQSRRAQSLLSF